MTNIKPINPILQVFYIIIVNTFLVSCNQAQESNFGDPGYDLAKPQKIIDLPAELNEISGVRFYQNNLLICNQDENADIYFIDIQSGKLTEKVETSLIGDFEDLEFILKQIYMLKSNGTIYEFEISKLKEKQYIKYPTQLTQKNDTEGLGFDKETNSLLIACKYQAGLKGDANNIADVRNIYQFSLQTKELLEKPFIQINLKELARYGLHRFMPSGIAVHPKTGEFYILSANQKALLVIDRENRILSVTRLKTKHFSQPEGICFDPTGEYMFISNEGKKSAPNILIFKEI